jgi:hypothetical protein
MAIGDLMLRADALASVANNTLGLTNRLDWVFLVIMVKRTTKHLTATILLVSRTRSLRLARWFRRHYAVYYVYIVLLYLKRSVGPSSLL